MDFFDIFFINTSVCFFIVQYFQAHVELHRADFRQRSPSEWSPMESKLFASPQVSFLSDKPNYHSTGLQTLLSLIVGLGNINCYIFLIYTGYHTLWSSAVFLLIFSVVLNRLLYALIRKKPAPRNLVTILAFLIVPVLNLLIWFLG